MKEVIVNDIKFKEMKQSDIKELREKIWKLNDRKCPVLGTDLELKNTALDHQHKKVNDQVNPVLDIVYA